LHALFTRSEVIEKTFSEGGGLLFGDAHMVSIKGRV
jgi:hypothetical protein